MTLLEIYNLIEAENNIDVVAEYTKYNHGNIPQSKEWIKTPYYTKLAAAAKVIKPKLICEIGTYLGMSAMCMSMFAPVITYDVKRQILDNNIIRNREIVEVINSDEEFCLKINFNQFQMIFIDIGNHQGWLEQKIHNILSNTWSGIAFYDDVYYNEKMKSFWNNIKEEKIETNWHPEANKGGFGIVKYGGRTCGC